MQRRKFSVFVGNRQGARGRLPGAYRWAHLGSRAFYASARGEFVSLKAYVEPERSRYRLPHLSRIIGTPPSTSGLTFTFMISLVTAGVTGVTFPGPEAAVLV